MLFSFLIFYYRLFAFGKILNRFLGDEPKFPTLFVPAGFADTMP